MTTSLYYEINNVLTHHGKNMEGNGEAWNMFDSVNPNSKVDIDIYDENNKMVASLSNEPKPKCSCNFMQAPNEGDNASIEYTTTVSDNSGSFTVYPYGSTTGEQVIWNHEEQAVTSVPEEAVPAHIDIKIEDNSFIRLDMNGGIYVNGKLVMTSTKILRAIEKILIDNGFLDDYTVKEDEQPDDKPEPVRLKTLIDNLRRKGGKT